MTEQTIIQPYQPPPKITISPQAKVIGWQNGILSWKLQPHQYQLYANLVQALENPQCYKYVVNCSRRFGKSTILMLIAFEQCLKRSNIDVRFTCDTQKHMKDIIASVKKEILSDCPESMRPFFNKSEGKFHFQNGSTLHTYGADNGIGESQRGVNSHLNIVDEAGFIDDLEEVLLSIILPQTDTTGGKTFIVSTPSDTPAHPFYSLALEAEQAGYYSKFTMGDNTYYSPEKKLEIFNSRGGINSTRVRREYFGEWVTEETRIVIPEWKENYVKVVEADALRQYYRNYVSMDIGLKDFTACLFGYYDLKNGLVIEDEWIHTGANITPKLMNDEIRKREKELWGALPSYKEPYKRIADWHPFIQLMANDHKLIFQATNKDRGKVKGAGLEAMITGVRSMIHQEKITINPRCTQLIGCLKYAIWNKTRMELDRVDTYGHFDALMALVYLVKNIDFNDNPIPALHNLDPATHYVSPYYIQDKNLNTTKQVFENMFKPPPRRK